MTTYITFGQVRGSSGVIYPTREAAERAVDRDRRICGKRGVYCDTHVAVVIDGRLYYDEDGQSPVRPSHGKSTGPAQF